jgi:hypothetical protein
MSNIIVNKIKRPARLQFLSYLGDVQGCGHIRVIFPFLLLNHYRQENLMVNAFYLTNYIKDPEFYKTFTIVQFQRAATDAHMHLIINFKKHIQPKYPIPVIYEIDDMLYNIPEWNYASLYYNKVEDNIKKMMQTVDAMTVSTSKLKEVYAPYCKNITVIPNHLPKFLWGDVYPSHEYKDEDEKIKILWSGSQNHFVSKQIVGNDIKGGDFGEKLISFIIKTTDIYDWHLVGAIPDELLGVKNKIHFHPWKNIFEYPQFLKGLEPDIAIAPLINNEFNSCKSSIKALEYNTVGAAGIYSDVEPYKNMTLKTKTDEEMISNIESLAKDIDLRAKVFRKDYDRVRNQLFWEENNNIKKYINSYLGLFGKEL